MHKTQVQSLICEYPMCHRAAKPMCHNYWACTLESASGNYGVPVPKLLTPTCREPEPHKESHHNKEPVPQTDSSPRSPQPGKSPQSNEDPAQQKNKHATWSQNYSLNYRMEAVLTSMETTIRESVCTLPSALGWPGALLLSSHLERNLFFWVKGLNSRLKIFSKPCFKIQPLLLHLWRTGSIDVV